nr:hypothetical protein [Tanacetum cinerariifolium]
MVRGIFQWPEVVIGSLRAFSFTMGKPNDMPASNSGDILKTTCEAAKIMAFGGINGAVSTAALAWNYLICPHGESLSTVGKSIIDIIPIPHILTS